MDKSWIKKSRLSPDYIVGVKSFLDFAFGKLKVEVIKCPCNRCSLAKYKSREQIMGDLMCHGFISSYTTWVLHGEDIPVRENAREVPANVAPVESNSTLNDMMDDLFPDTNLYGGYGSSEPMNNDIPSTSSGNYGEGQSFAKLLDDYNQDLYTGCTKFTKLSFMLKLYHIKYMCDISAKGISMVLDLLKEAFEHAKLPDSFNDMKKVIRKLGLTYESIHACPNDCMLYWEADAEREICRVCKVSRWKEDTSTENTGSGSKKKEKKAPAKVLRYFPLKPRLQRLYESSKTATHMRWHATANNNDGKLRHPRDGEAC